MSELQLSDLRTGRSLIGLEDTAVTIIQAELSSESGTITYRRQDDSISEALLFADDLDGLSIFSPQETIPFSGNPEEFRLVSEALRIKTAGLHETMSAVTSSEIQPLPHQIRAVYEEMLPRIPLHFLLADDPGAGKTIMTGLYIKELLLRNDVERCLIVAPGGLVTQWQEELKEKFSLNFHILGSKEETLSSSGNPFQDHDLLIVRMDSVARSHDVLLPLLEQSSWDLTVVDEAHRMSASKGFRKELHKTKRFLLGETLREITRHLLLLTATPHNGDNEAFQAFLSLLDPDRFEGAFQSSTTEIDTSGLMRRMVKEELLTFEGRPLFPERKAITVPYSLSPAEMSLYEEVTSYVRDEMRRAENALEGRQSKAVGFALTVLQRRLASSPAAILNSLSRRRERLAELRKQLLQQSPVEGETFLTVKPGTWPNDDFDDLDDLDYSAEELEKKEEDSLSSGVTAARSLYELEKEVIILDGLVTRAQQVYYSGEDCKWSELRQIIEDKILGLTQRRKLIIFTEHRDTLDYLCKQIRTITGHPDSVVTIHGGTPRMERQRIKENFTHDDSVQFLVATDAAGEGLNLQAAHLMVNYDLPWNPNRIEQRFGRIHRIGQRHVCMLWNLVATETREGAVYQKLLEKMDTQRAALGTRVFDILGDAFQNQSLRSLMIQAIRYIDDPQRLQEIDRVIDAEVSHGLDSLREERALASETLTSSELEEMRREMDEARARRLQPHYISQFFHEALEILGGRILTKGSGTSTIRRIPQNIHARTRQNATPIASRYDRITFDSQKASGTNDIEFLAPGHPLLDAVVDETLDNFGTALKQGTILVDNEDPTLEPWLLVTSSTEVRDGTGATRAREFSYLRINQDSTVSDSGPAPYLDFSALPADIEPEMVLGQIKNKEWLTDDLESATKLFLTNTIVRQLLTRTKETLTPELKRTEELVTERLLEQQNFLAREAINAAGHQSRYEAGEEKRPPSKSATSYKDQVEKLRLRLETRKKEIALQRRLTATPPQVRSTALVIPAGFIKQIQGADEETLFQHARNTDEIDRRAVAATLAAEKALGRIPEEMAHNNPGFDIRSRLPNSTEPSVFLEVKGRISGAEDFSLSHTQVLTGLNIGANHRIVLVDVSPDGPEHDQVRYLADFCQHLAGSSIYHEAHVLKWKKIWEQGTNPV